MEQRRDVGGDCGVIGDFEKRANIWRNLGMYFDFGGQREIGWMQPDGHYIRKAANRDTSKGEKNSFRSNFLLC